MEFNFGTILSIIWTVAPFVGLWKIFEKLGRKGWEGIVPVYDMYVLFEVLYGNGWKFLLLLIPIYNVYLLIKLDADLGKKFGKSTGFIIGMIFLTPIFYLILGLDDSQAA